MWFSKLSLLQIACSEKKKTKKIKLKTKEFSKPQRKCRQIQAMPNQYFGQSKELRLKKLNFFISNFY